LLCLLAVDGLTHLPQHNPPLPAALFRPGFARDSANLKPPPKHGESRLFISPQAEDHLLNSGVQDREADFLGRRLAFWSNLNALDGLPKVNGSSTLRLREENEIQSLLYATTNAELPHLLDFLGVSQTTAPGQVAKWTNRATWLPLATAGQRPIFADTDTILQALVRADFDPRAVVYLPAELEKPSVVGVRDSSPAKIIASEFTAHSARLEVEADAAALVVIAQSFYHPWQAALDGQPVRIWQANHAFQALKVPRGRHLITLTYRDGNFLLGAGLSMVALAACAAIWFRRGEHSR
jgi:hypothetical protein